MREPLINLARMWSLLLPIVCVLAGCNMARNRAPVGTPLAIAVQRSPWEGGSGGSELKTDHYVIYTTASSKELTAFLPGFLEAAYSNYLQLTGLGEKKLQQPLPVYMMGSRAEWASLTTSVVGKEAAGPYLSIQAGGYCYKGVCVFWDIGNLGTFTVASHEGLHQFLHHRMSDYLPMWLEEGLCVTVEGYDFDGQSVTFTSGRNVLRFTDLRAAIVQGRWIPLERLLEMDSGDAVSGSPYAAVGYYGQLWALIQFIRSRRDFHDGIARILADAQVGQMAKSLGYSRADFARLRATGRNYNKTISRQVFERYISSDLKTFDKDFLEFAKKLARL